MAKQNNLNLSCSCQASGELQCMKINAIGWQPLKPAASNSSKNKQKPKECLKKHKKNTIKK